MARDEVPQEPRPALGETTGGVPADARHAARGQDEPPARSPVNPEEPGWLDEDTPLAEHAPPDPEGDERDWADFGQAAQVTRLAAIAEAEQRQVRARIIAGGIEYGFAHTAGAPGLPGIKAGPGGGFAQDEPLDVATPEPSLAMAADYAAGPKREFRAVCDDEVFGVLGARRRLTSRQQWETLMTIGELIRRRPARHAVTLLPSGMPAVWGEGLAGELALGLAISRRYACELLGLAWDLIVKLPVTSALLRDGVLDQAKASAVAAAFANLTAEQAKAAEEILYRLGDTAERTLGTIRDRAARAAMEVDPDSARKRREQGAKERRVEVRPEDSGNASISGRELPPDAVLVMDATLTARARELARLGVQGDMDELRALAFMERFGAADPTAACRREGGDDSGPNDSGKDDSGPGGGGGGRPTGPGGGPCPACGGTDGGGAMAVRMHLTAPALTLTERAGRPGYLQGTGPADPDLVRDLADRAAGTALGTYCFTLTDPDGRPVAHACGKPAPADPARRHRKRKSPGKADGTGPPGRAGLARLTLIDRGPPGGHRTWLFAHGTRRIIFEFEEVAGPCDHAHQAAGHDPGKHLRHLTGILNAECTHPSCRRPQQQCDYEHSLAYDDGGITCLCQNGPVCERDHQDKQRPGWKLRDTGQRGWFRWTTPSGRTYLNGPTIYPI